MCSFTMSTNAEVDIYTENGTLTCKILQNAKIYNEAFVYNMSRLSRSVLDAVGLVRQLKNLGAELYAADRNMVRITEEILKAGSDIPT